MTTLVGYVRVSTSQQVRGVSLDVQCARLEAYADFHGHSLYEVLSDGGVSAKCTAANPTIHHLMRLLKMGTVGGVVVHRLDRLVRDVTQAIAFVELLRETKTELHSVCEPIDLSTALGEFSFTMLAAYAQAERSRIGELMTTVLRYKRRRGEKTGGDVPFGYDVFVRGRGADKVRCLVSNAKEQKTLRLIQKLYVDGVSLRAIAAELKRRRIRTKTGKTSWNSKTIWSLARRMEE